MRLGSMTGRRVAVSAPPFGRSRLAHRQGENWRCRLQHQNFVGVERCAALADVGEVQRRPGVQCRPEPEHGSRPAAVPLDEAVPRSPRQGRAERNGMNDDTPIQQPMLRSCWRRTLPSGPDQHAISPRRCADLRKPASGGVGSADSSQIRQSMHTPGRTPLKPRNPGRTPSECEERQ
jgi:hypothetical protein